MTEASKGSDARGKTTWTWREQPTQSTHKAGTKSDGTFWAIDKGRLVRVEPVMRDGQDGPRINSTNVVEKP